MVRFRRRRLLLRSAIAAGAAGSVLAASVHAGTATTGVTVSVTAGKPTEQAFVVSPKRVTAGTVTFKITNRGKLKHRFELCASPDGGSANACAGKMTPLLAPGKSASLTLTLAAGDYEYVDAAPGRTAGMRGVLIVSGGSKSTGGGTSTTPKGGKTPSGGTTSTGSGSSGGAAANLPTGFVGDPTAGKAVFLAAGCSTCHTLAAAGATGGIDLDGFAPDEATVIINVTDGNTSGMPDFSQQLTKTQIYNVAAFVFCSTHKGAAGC
jgi:mono/diheme cytochrome c family protein